MMNSIALKRITKELEEIERNPPLEVTARPIDSKNLFHWEGVLTGPQDSLYSKGFFRFVIEFPKDYPMSAPKVEFLTKIFHPNISLKGDVCVDILKNRWSSVFTVSKIMLSIASLLTDPNPESALNGESARLYITDRQEYNRIVRKWVQLYARPQCL